MSEKLCTLRTKGGGGAKQTETVLWTNPSPNSDFSSGDITLSDSLSNYDYIKIITNVGTNSSVVSSTIYSVSDFKTFAQNSTPSGCGHIAIMNSSNTRRSRGVVYVNDTKVNFKVCYEDGTNTINNSNAIPLQIIGIKNMGGWRDGKSFYYPFAIPTQNVSIPIGFVPKKMMINLVTSYSTSVRLIVYDAEVSTTQYRWVTTSSNYSPPTYYDLGRDVGAGSWNFADNGTSVVFTTVNSDLKGVTIMATA